MAKLKSFEQFLAEMDRAEEIQQDVIAAGEPDTKGPEETEEEADSVQAESVETEEVEEGNAFGDAVRKAKEAGEDEFEFDGETYKVEEEIEAAEEVTEEVEATEETEEVTEEIEAVEETEEVTEEVEATEETEEVTEEVEETEEVTEEETEEVEEIEEVVESSCSEMLEKCYESCKNEAKAYEEDAHDEHTIESYMKENAALVAALAAKTLKEMKEEYSVEAYEAACNQMIEAYTNKMNEMKDADSVSDAADMAE